MSNGEGKLSVAGVIVLPALPPGHRRPEGDSCCRCRDEAEENRRRRRIWRGFRRRREQHAEVLHGRSARSQDVADGGAGDESLFHRIRHGTPRLREALPLPIRRQWRCLIRRRIFPTTCTRKRGDECFFLSACYLENPPPFTLSSRICVSLLIFLCWLRNKGGCGFL